MTKLFKEQTLTHQAGDSATEDVVQLLCESGLSHTADATRLMLNEAIRLERSLALEAGPYQRSEKRPGYANGFQPKTLRTRVGELALQVPQMRGNARCPEKMASIKRRSRTYHHGDPKSAMVRAALELVRKKGPRVFTLNEPFTNRWRERQCPLQSFQRDKEALLIEIVLLGNPTRETELQAAPDDVETAQKKLPAVYLAYVFFAQQHPELFFRDVPIRDR